MRPIKFLSKSLRERAAVLKRQRLIKKVFEVFNLAEPSLKQKKVLTWWREGSPYKNHQGIICDGAVRSGKTISTTLSFLEWAMTNFNDVDFAFCSKTVGSFKRNILRNLRKIAKRKGYKFILKNTENLVIVEKGDTRNYFYIFGGKDEGSQELIQGMTLAGVFFDEVVLMPESFVSQAMARCSVEGSKFWFTCNPGSPFHWFKKDYIDLAKEKKLLYLHFTMEDNPTLSLEVKERYKSLYTGVFYKRYILGLWLGAEGLVYDLEDCNLMEEKDIPLCDKYYIAGDYGTQNPMAWGFLGIKEKKVYLIDEFHHSGRETQRPMTDEEYANKFIEWKKKNEKKWGYVQYSIFDPSAASFKLALTKKGIKVISAKNDVKGQADEIAGIPLVQNYLANKEFLINRNCKYTIAEFYTYCWDNKKLDQGIEVPIKEADHHMDKIRYFFNTVIGYKYLEKQKIRAKPRGL